MRWSCFHQTIHRERDKAFERETCPDWRSVQRGVSPDATVSNSLPGGHSEREPPDPIPNSEVKTLCADGSVPFGHARVGHCQALYEKTPAGKPAGVFLLACWFRLAESDRAPQCEAIG